MTASMRAQILGGERLRLGEVVVEAVLDGRTDGHLHVGEQALHRLRHHVRGGVAHGVEGGRLAVELARQPEVSILFGVGHGVLKRREHRQGPGPQVLSGVHGRLGRFRTADLLCVREALSH